MRRINIFGLILLAVFFAACTPTKTTPGPSAPTGTQGLVLSYLENAPGPVLYSGETADFILKIQNRGAHDTAAQIWHSGHDTSIIGLTKAEHGVSTISGKKEGIPGGEALDQHQASVNLLPSYEGSYSANILTTVCYSYQTEAPAVICIDPDPTTTQDEICRPSGTSLGGGQGAPVAVTSVQQEAAKGRTRLIINLQNAGGGEVYKQGAGCINPSAEDENVVDVLEVKLSDSDITSSCSPRPVRLINGQGTLSCVASGLGGRAYSAGMSIKVAYGYKSTITKGVTVKKLQ